MTDKHMPLTDEQLHQILVKWNIRLSPNIGVNEYYVPQLVAEVRRLRAAICAALDMGKRESEIILMDALDNNCEHDKRKPPQREARS